MHTVIACLVCGGDLATDNLLLQAAIAGGITTPWMLRSKLREVIGRVRRGRSAGDDQIVCPVPDEEPDPPTSPR